MDDINRADFDQDRLHQILDAGREASAVLDGLRDAHEGLRDDLRTAEVALGASRASSRYPDSPQPTELVERVDKLRGDLRRLQERRNALSEQHAPAIALAKSCERFAEKHLKKRTPTPHPPSEARDPDRVPAPQPTTPLTGTPR